MDLTYTAVYVKVPEGYAAFVEELPGANTQGYTLDEARRNLEEAIQLVLESDIIPPLPSFASKSSRCHLLRV